MRLGAGCAMRPGRMDVFYARADGALMQRAYDGTWRPAAVSWGPGRIDVYARGTDAALWRKTWAGNWIR